MNHRLHKLPAFDRALTALGDVVVSTGAIDGALATVSGTDLRVLGSLRSRIAQRVICGASVGSVGAAIMRGELAWLEPSAPEGLYLPVHTQVLYVPFQAAGQRSAALLAFDHRLELSVYDRQFLQTAFSGPARTAPSLADLPLAA